MSEFLDEYAEIVRQWNLFMGDLYEQANNGDEVARATYLKYSALVLGEASE